MEIDLSELKNKSYECLEGCAMCCLCQPELSEAELEYFKTQGLTAGLTREHIQGFVSEKPTAIKLQGGNGACHFLKDRRCTIHEHRPAFCRQFPVHVHALHRIQLNGNLSCRGITQGGSTLLEHGKSILSRIPEPMKKQVMDQAGQALGQFQEEAQENSVHQSPEQLRRTVGVLLPHLARPGGMGQLLAFADSEPEIGGMPAEEIVNMILDCEPAQDLQEVANQGNYAQLDLDNPAWLPVYVGANFKWLVYRSEDGQIVFYRLEPDGSLEKHESFHLRDIELLPPDPQALTVFAGYASLLNSRDQFLGYAYQVCQDQEFAYDLMTVYLGLMGTTLLDLWWRSCLIGYLQGRKELDKELAEEGIRAFDMDCLDMPTMGVFF